MLESARPQNPTEALQRFFGYPAFRPGQEEIIQSALSGRDTLVIMPTGGGKSLCYQVPALLMKGVTLVVSPLIALMKDQVDALAGRGVRATTINSTLEFPEVRQRMTDIRYGLYSLVYVAPERFENSKFLELIRDVKVSLFAVDEAHCISEWGHDFRPSYLRLGEALNELNRPPVLALTATATPYVQEDIIAQLGLKEPRRFVRGFDRPNLSYTINTAENKDQELRAILKKEMERDGSTIIYCGTRKNVESVGTMLHAERFPVTIYHAGLPDANRTTAQEAFISGRARFIVATNAFGMGIDKADVRNVIHMDLPGSIEAYYQEAGRAGRDGQPSDCTILYQPRDRRLQEFFIRNTYPDRSAIDAVYDAIWDIVRVGLGSRYEGVLVPDEREIISRAKIHGSALYGILGALEKNEIIRKVRAERLGGIRFLADSREIQHYYQLTRDENRKKTITALLRTLGGASLSRETLFNPEDLARKHDIPFEAFDQSLRALMMSRLIQYTPPTPGTGYQFLQERLPIRNVRIDERSIEVSRNRALTKLDAMERYAQTLGCRRDFILEYFCAEIETARCGRCDNCRTGADRKPVELRPQTRRAMEQLLAAAYELGGRFGKMTLVDLLRGTTNPTIAKFRLEGYPRYGELREIDRRELADIATQLIDKGLLESAMAVKPTVKITPTGREAVAHLALKKFTIGWSGNTAEPSKNPKMLELLQQERDRLGRAEGLGPQAICPDDLLISISNDLPTSRTDFMEIEGMTETVYGVCGAPFIALIQNIQAEETWQEETPQGIPDRLKRTYLLYQDGDNLEEIARRSSRQPSTVSNHLEELITLGVELDIQRFVPPGIIKAVAEELKRVPNVSLRDLRGLLGNAVDYPELRIAAAWVRAGREE